ncbi:hypothetical protein CDD83_5325 [Cordyceps sp. RAO-2017]|nr:hypothetical protein CDD83_5325 [Cordyceps sp. RAO-2017]
MPYEAVALFEPRSSFSRPNQLSVLHPRHDVLSGRQVSCGNLYKPCQVSGGCLREDLICCDPYPGWCLSGVCCGLTYFYCAPAGSDCCGEKYCDPGYVCNGSTCVPKPGLDGVSTAQNSVTGTVRATVVPSALSSASSSASASSTAPPSPTATPDSGGGTPVGAIVGGVVGGLAVIVIAVIALVWLLRSRSSRETADAPPLMGHVSTPPPGHQSLPPYALQPEATNKDYRESRFPLVDITPSAASPPQSYGAGYPLQNQPVAHEAPVQTSEHHRGQMQELA